MKKIIFIIFAFAMLISCSSEQKKAATLQHDTTPIVVDYPAGVLVISDKSPSKLINKEISIAEKLLASRKIPILDSTSQKVVFIKTNGDRVTLQMDDLAGKYDIILFNTINNPIPIRLSELKTSLDKMFFKPGKDIPIRERSLLITQKMTSESDTLSIWKEIKQIEKIRNRDKKIIVNQADTALIRISRRIIPGIQWVEQRMDTRRILKIDFSNDIITYANTDRYFTNGITIEMQAPWLSNSPANKLLIPYKHKAFVTHSLSLVTDMYTPTDTRVAPKLNNDRPYASYLYFSSNRTAADAIRKLKISSQLDLGYIGPYSPGSYLQKVVHKTFPTNDTPLGWETQINSDLILNYSIQAEKALFKSNTFLLLAGAEVQAGTLHTNAGFGLHMQLGKAEPYFGLAENDQWPKFQYYMFCKTNLKYVAYNALLQGGIFNQDNVFTLEGSQVQRTVSETEAGLHMQYKGLGIELSQHFLSPEYKGGQAHKWGKIRLLFGF